jgi:hypothetical protein
MMFVSLILLFFIFGDKMTNKEIHYELSKSMKSIYNSRECLKFEIDNSLHLLGELYGNNINDEDYKDKIIDIIYILNKMKEESCDKECCINNAKVSVEAYAEMNSVDHSKYSIDWAVFTIGVTVGFDKNNIIKDITMKTIMKVFSVIVFIIGCLTCVYSCCCCCCRCCRKKKKRG